MHRSHTRGAIALGLALGVVSFPGCQSTADIIAEGDELRSEKRYDEALERYRDAQERSDIGGTEKIKVARARGEILLQKGDLNGAEQSFRRMPESSGARSALLAKVALARGDRAQAETLDRDAYAKGERGPLTLDLASIVGAEAETPERLLEAAKLLAEGGADPEQAKAAEVAAQVWLGANRGEAPAALLPKLEAVHAAAPKYPAIELVRCDLLQRAGDSKADQAYAALATFEPRPSAAFLKRASEQQAAGAARSGNQAELESALKGLSKEDAAAKRAELARGLEAEGDLLGALALWKKTADAGGSPVALALCEVARLEAARGRDAEARAALEKARAEKEPDAQARALLALATARQDDPLGARKALEDAAKDATLGQGTRDDAARLARAAKLLEDALDALAHGSGSARALARAAVAAGPEVRLASAALAACSPEGGPADPVKVAASEASVARAASGSTRAALVRASVGLLCGAGQFEAAVKLADPDADATLAALAELAPAAIARLLDLGRVEDCAKLFKALKEKGLVARASDLVARVRADATFGALWQRDSFVGAVGRPDPLARPAPYVCALTLADGESFGVVRVTEVSPDGLEVLVPGHAARVKVAKDRLSVLSARGLPDDAFDALDGGATIGFDHGCVTPREGR